MSAKKILLLVVMLSLVGLVWPLHGQDDTVSSELLVRFKSDVPAAVMARVHAAAGARFVRDFSIVPNLHVVRVPAAANVSNALKFYEKNPHVLYVEPNAVWSISTVPNDTYYNNLWGLNNTNDADIDAPEAWDLSRGSSNVVVAVIDTGIDYNHQDLKNNMWRNESDCDADGVDDDNNGYKDDCYGIDTYNNDSNPMDDNGHGTHVAGTIGAVGNNSLGVVGVNWNVRLMACKFLSASGSGSTTGAIACLQYIKTMRDRGVPIVATNNSWGGGSYSQALEDAIKAQSDILFIAAAGNNSTNNDTSSFYPANYFLPNVIAVAATTNVDGLASFSNYGVRTVHVGAPGSSILSTMPNNTYGTLSGTSMATPHVTGLAALIKAYNPIHNWANIRNLIFAGVDPLPALQGKTVLGGRINAYNALSCANRSVFALLRPFGTVSTSTTTIAALYINCAAPAGPLSVTIYPDGTSPDTGSTLTLSDDGSGADLAANDGIYSAIWSTSDLCPGTYRFDFRSSEGTLVYTTTIQKSGGASCADLSITITDSPDPVAAGGTLTYTLTVRNAGPQSASGITVTNTLPAEVTFVNTSGSNWSCSRTNNIVTCTRSSALSAGTSSTITITVTVPFTNESVEIRDSASVSATTIDPVITNNRAEQTTTVTPAVSCSGVTLSSSPSSVYYAPTATSPATKTITLTVTNKSGGTRLVTSITPQSGEPFVITKITPTLPKSINNGKTQYFYVTTQVPAGQPAVYAYQPYFDTVLDCGVLATASNPALMLPLRIDAIALSSDAGQLRLVAHGQGIQSVRLLVFDLSGTLRLDRAAEGSLLTMPAADDHGRLLANSVYLYVLTVQGYDGQVTRYVSKLVILR